MPPDVPPGRSRGGCMRCQQSRSLQLAVKVLYGIVAFLVIAVVVLASLGEPTLAEHVAPSVNKQNSPSYLFSFSFAAITFEEVSRKSFILLLGNVALSK